MQKENQHIGAHLVIHITQMVADYKRIERGTIQLAADPVREPELTLDKRVCGRHGSRVFARQFVRAKQLGRLAPYACRFVHPRGEAITSFRERGDEFLTVAIVERLAKD